MKDRLKDTKLGKIIKGTGITKQFIIENTGINRNIFYEGLRRPTVFTDAQLREIAKVIGVKASELLELKSN